MTNHSRNKYFHYFRQCQRLKSGLMVCLILLQCAIPFLHAHSGIDQSPPGLHIPGFEQVLDEDSTSTVATDSMIAVDTHSEIIIGVGSALESVDDTELNPETVQQPLLFLTLISFILLLPLSQPSGIRFPCRQSGFYSLFQTSNHSPRSPPYSM